MGNFWNCWTLFQVSRSDLILYRIGIYSLFFFIVYIIISAQGECLVLYHRGAPALRIVVQALKVPSLAADSILDHGGQAPGAFVTLRHVSKYCGILGCGGSHGVGYGSPKRITPWQPRPTLRLNSTV